jgi:hypothetical protein
MELNNDITILDELVQYWENQSIKISGLTKEKIKNIEKDKGITLPLDFVNFYRKVNGMEDLYPNWHDKEGFLFYPLEMVINYKEGVGFEVSPSVGNVLIFVDYLQKCWWYGVDVVSENEYTIGIIADGNTFKPITNSLFDFIRLYLLDSPVLYDYS